MYGGIGDGISAMAAVIIDSAVGDGDVTILPIFRLIVNFDHFACIYNG